MASISLHGLRRVHPDGTVALSGVDLTVGDGELVGIIGPSGSGKSTLLRVVAGVEPITDGLVRIGGRDMTGVRPRDRNIALVSQSRNLYTFLDVAEQLALPLELRRTRSAEITRRVDAEGRAFGLGHIWHRRPRQLSAGDVQRTALARAMIRLPQALLADEPMQLLDPPTQTRVRAELHRLHIASAMTVLYTTNDHNQIMGIADRVAVLNDGRIVQTDPPQQLLSRPRNRFVAGFVGEPAMTFMAATVVADAGLGWLQVGSQRLRVPGGLPGPLRQRAGMVVTLGARPDMVQARCGEDPVDLCLDGVAGEVRRLGPHDLVEVSLPQGHWMATFPAGSGLHRGDRVSVTVAVRRLSVFDPVDGTAVWHGD